MNGTSAPTIFGSGNVLETATTQEYPLGTVMITEDGREFRYAKAGAAALVVGNVIQGAAQVTTHARCTAAATAVNSQTITLTLGATNAVTANQYAEGWAVIDTTPGLGYMYPISSHPAAAGGASLTLTLRPDALVKVALTTSSKVTLVANPYASVIQSPVTTLTGAVVGVAVSPIPIANFGWLQTKGAGAVLIAGTPGVGLAVVVPATAAGAVVIDSAAAATKVVGSMMVTGVDATVLPVWLDIC